MLTKYLMYYTKKTGLALAIIVVWLLNVLKWPALMAIAFAGALYMQADQQRHEYNMMIAGYESEVALDRTTYQQRGADFLKVCVAWEVPGEACILAFGRGGGG